MKTYLNRQECNDLLMLAAEAEHIRTTADSWHKRDNLPGKEAGWLRQAASLVGKTLEAIISRQPVDMGEKILKSAGAYQMVCVAKKQSKVQQEKALSDMEEEGAVVSVSALEGLSEMALISCCAPCMRKTREEKLQCPGRDIYFALGIPLCDENPPDGVCPWDNGEVAK